jgi:myo-inositol-1(or 4)-monophosphatase
MWDKIAEVLNRTVLRAGHLLRKNFGQEHRVDYKSPIDLVTEMDRAVEALFIKTIRKHFPDHEILSEEMVEGVGGNPWERLPERGKIRWIIDPLDGTTNYAHGFPHSSVSAGVVYRGRVMLGAVYHPWRRELYFARRGSGAWKNQERIQVSGVRRLERALLVTASFPHENRMGRQIPMEPFKALSHACQAVRRTGSAALDLADVACGRFDGFWDLSIKPWDVAAGSLLIEEAGGKITNLSGRRLDLYGQAFIAGNKYLHPVLAAYLAKAGF